MRRAFALYEWLAPLVLAPLSFWLWQRESDGMALPVAMAWALPICWAYIVPGVGTNLLKVWEFDSRMRIGRFRLQHGFVFGSATSMIAWLVHGSPAADLGDALRLAFLLASVLGFWNLLYDIKALEAGILRVYNQPWAEGQPAASIAMDYAPWFFAGFGAVQGLAIGLAELYAPALQSMAARGLAFGLALIAACGLPSLAFIGHSLRRHGHRGTRPVARAAGARSEGARRL